MNTFQRTIKYLAMAFAIVLTIGILTTIVNVVSGLVYTFNGDEDGTIDYSMDFTDVSQLDISHELGKLNLKVGSGFRVEARNVSDGFRANLSNGTLVIGNSTHIKKLLWFDFGTSRSKSVVNVYVPKDFVADRIKIDSGFGNMSLEDISAEDLIIDAGVGNIKGSNLSAKKVEIDGGVGEVDFTNVNFTDLDLNHGVGNIKIDGVILGKSEIDGGIGGIKLGVRGAREDYAIRISAGLGRVRVNGKKFNSDYNDTYNADNIIKIDGGLGEVDLVFKP